MHYVTDPSTVSAVVAARDRVLRCPATLPDQVFRQPYSVFAFFDYGVLQTVRGWHDLARAAKEPIYALYLSPDHGAFQSERGFFGLMEILPGESPEEIRSALGTSPTNSLADAFTYGCMRCFVSTIDPNAWAVFGDQGWDLAIVGFVSPHARRDFLAANSAWRVMSLVEVIDRIVAESKPVDHSEFITELLASYGHDGGSVR